MTERAIIFDRQGDELIGILHPGQSEARVGVLVIVGGPQYRVGSHRQFVLLARALAAAGIPAFRFDYRGMGDASGTMRSFEEVQDDIAAAIDSFVGSAPTLEKVVLWGLCDAASAAIDYGWRDPRVAGLVLLNPWVRTEEGLAKTFLKHYYLQRLTSLTFWSGLCRGRVNPLTSLRSLLIHVRKAAGGQSESPANGLDTMLVPASDSQDRRIEQTPLKPGETLPVRMAEGWRRFKGRILLILSGNDLTAAEFLETVGSSDAWSGLLEAPSVSRRDLPDATHTFSCQAWRAQVEHWTLEWLGAEPAVAWTTASVVEPRA